MISTALIADTRALVATMTFPCRLSALIAACPDTGTSAATELDLMVGAALRAFDASATDSAPPPGEQDSAGDHGALSAQALAILGLDAAAFADEHTLDCRRWSGQDLIVCVDRDQADEVRLGRTPYPKPRQMSDRHRRAATTGTR